VALVTEAVSKLIEEFARLPGIGKKSADAVRLQVTPLAGKIYRIEVYNELEPGEYSLSPNNSDAAFCFAVF